MTDIFPAAARTIFAANYPETPHVLRHKLTDHELLGLAALADLAERLPESSAEYNPGDLPIGIDPAKVPAHGLSIGETIRRIEETQSWAVLKNVEQDPSYRALLMRLLEELRPVFERSTGKMLTPQAYIFVSSPNAVTPYHFDPEHNILLQVRGQKTMTVFPAGDQRFAPASAHENYHLGGHRNLQWDDSFMVSGTPFDLSPGQAVFVPVMAPHFVQNGPEPSISLSITWRSEWSYAEADAHAFNRLLRRFGMSPTPPGRYPAQNRVKSYSWRAMRKIGMVR